MKLNHILLAALIGTMSAGCDTDVPIDQLDATSNEDICFATGGYFQDGICYCADVADETKYPRDAEGNISNLDSIPAILKCDKGVACALNYDSGQGALVCAGKNKKLHDSFGIGASCQDDIYENMKVNMKGFFTIVSENPYALDFEGTESEFKESLRKTLLDTVAVPQKCINDENGIGVISTCLGAYNLKILNDDNISRSLQLVKGYLNNYRTIKHNSELSSGQQEELITEFSLPNDKEKYKCETEAECKSKLLTIYSQVLGSLREIFTGFTWQEPFQCPMNVSCKQTVRGLGECGDCRNDDTETPTCRHHPKWVKVTSTYSELSSYALANDSFFGYCKNGEFEITKKCVQGCDSGSSECRTSDIIIENYKTIPVADLNDSDNKTKLNGYKGGTTVCVDVGGRHYIGKLIDSDNVKQVVYSERNECPKSNGKRETCNSDWTFCKNNVLTSIENFKCNVNDKPTYQQYRCLTGHDVITERFASFVMVCNDSAGFYSYFNSKGEVRGYQCPEGTTCGINGSVKESNVCVAK